MRSLVADTNAVVRHLATPDKLGARARRVLADADAARATCHVPVIVLVEISLLYERGRLRFGADRVLEELASRPGWQVLALDIAQSLAFAELAPVKDPMDRLILAAARALGAPLISADGALDGRGVTRIWD